MINHVAIKLLIVLIFLTFVESLNNGLAMTPPMGWLAWERFKCNVNCKKSPKDCISENLFMEMADHMVKDGFKQAGYVYVNIDDCWLAKERDASGKLIPDPERFPRGIKFLSDYMHSRNLKLGIYENYGRKTCMGFPGTLGHMEQDAKTFAEWEVDMVKLDGCFTPPQSLDEGYISMGKHLNHTGHPMLYSCSWPYYQMIEQMEPNYSAISKHCNMWRVYHDIQDNWHSIEKVIDFFGDNQELLTKYVAPGRWADPDMLVFGNVHLTEKQANIQMAVWCILPAPLLMSNDLRTLHPKFRRIFLNREAIAINQDPLGKAGKRIYNKDGLEVWKRKITPVYNGQHSYAFLFLSRQKVNTKINVTFHLQQFGLTNPYGYKLTEVMEHQRYGIIGKDHLIAIKLAAIDCLLFNAQVLQG